jgi:hypothetical protein
MLPFRLKPLFDLETSIAEGLKLDWGLAVASIPGNHVFVTPVRSPRAQRESDTIRCPRLRPLADPRTW